MLAGLCDLDDSECPTAKCYEGCRDELAEARGERIAEFYRCQMERGCNEFRACSSVLTGCGTGIVGRCTSCFGCNDVHPAQDDPEYWECEHARLACRQSAGHCDADLVVESCGQEERRGVLECSVAECIEHSAADMYRAVEFSCGR